MCTILKINAVYMVLYRLILQNNLISSKHKIYNSIYFNLYTEKKEY